MSEPLRVLVTGAAGQIGYSLTYMIANGDIFGKEQELTLLLYDLPSQVNSLRGLSMELMDCAFPLLADAIPAVDPRIAFKDVAVAFLAGAMPRKEGMERKDLIAINCKILREQAEFLEKYARKNCLVTVIANPVQTNTYICTKFAPSIPRQNFCGLTRLDQNRATAEIAVKLGVKANIIKNVIIWGNHSPTLYPDVNHAKYTVQGKMKHVADAINDQEYLDGAFVQSVQNRGAAVIELRTLSSAMSAAKAVCDHMRDWWFGTPPGQYVTMGVFSDGAYDVPEEIVCSFPVQIRDKEPLIVHHLPMSDFAKAKLNISVQELIDERKIALALFNDIPQD